MSSAPDWYRQDVLNFTDEFADKNIHLRSLFLTELQKTADWIAEHPNAGSAKYAGAARIPGLRYKAFRIPTSELLVFYVVAADGTATMRRLVHAKSDFISKLNVLRD